jgi:hypothetical protein
MRFYDTRLGRFLQNAMTLILLPIWLPILLLAMLWCWLMEPV